MLHDCYLLFNNLPVPTITTSYIFNMWEFRNTTLDCPHTLSTHHCQFFCSNMIVSPYLLLYPIVQLALRDILGATLGAIQHHCLLTSLMNGDEYIDEIPFLVGFNRGSRRSVLLHFLLNCGYACRATFRQIQLLQEIAQTAVAVST